MNYLLSSANPLVIYANIKGKKPHWAVAILLTFGFLIMGQLLALLLNYPIEPLIKTFPNPALKSAFSVFSKLILGNMPVVSLIFLWMHFYEKRPFSYLGFKKENALKLFFKGICCGIVLFFCVVGFLALLHLVSWENGNPSLQGKKMLFPTILLLIGFIAQGATEEILCRGWLMPMLAARYNLWVGIILSSSLFGILHGFNAGVTAVAIVNIILVGIFFSLFALRQGSLWGACGLHGIWNWLQGNFFGFEVSGHDCGPTLLNLKEIGPDWITGGTFGPEGGIICTLLILIGITIILFLNQLEKKKIQK